MPDRLQGVEGKAAVSERRAGQRLRVSSLVYVELGKQNGGIVTCIAENGLALMAAANLGEGVQGDELLRMRIQLPGFPGGVETNGQVVWRGNSGKEAGVKFVDLGVEAREQIRNWISAEASKSEVRLDQARLPEMQLPTSKPAKPHGPRFSFSDVASSRVDGEEDALVYDLPRIGESDDVPSHPVQNGVFAEASKVVASAFESPALTEEQEREVSSVQDQLQTQATPGEEGRRPEPSSILDRRDHARRQILLFTYAVLGEDNGGLVFNLGEGGLALTAAAALKEHHFEKMRVRFPDSEDWIETKGRLAWIGDSGKEAGIEFVDLPEAARARIREWVRLGEPATDLRRQEREPRTRQDEVQETPSLATLESSVSEPSESRAPFRERLRTPASSASALFTSGIKGAFARAAVRKRVAKIKPPRRPEPSVRARSRVARNALASAALVTVAGAGWIFLRRGSLNEASGIIAQNVPNASIPSESRQETEVSAGTRSAIADPPIQQIQKSEKVVPQPDVIKPAAPNLYAKAILKENIRNDASAAETPAGNSSAHGSDKLERKMPSVPPTPREQKPKPQPSVMPASVRPVENKPAENKPVNNKPVENKPIENKPVKTAEVRPTQSPTQNKDLSTVPPPSLSAPPVHNEAAPALEMETEKPPVAPPPKQPDAPVARTPLVTVSFDAYPSIRIPKAENPKKSRQGKSLQMGRLLTRAEPVYPEEAKQQGVEGAVKVHAIFNREGTVHSLISVSGPPLLVPAAMNAVRQWRYSQTILGGQAMETEQDVTVVFRLSNGISKN